MFCGQLGLGILAFCTCHACQFPSGGPASAPKQGGELRGWARDVRGRSRQTIKLDFPGTKTLLYVDALSEFDHGLNCGCHWTMAAGPRPGVVTCWAR